MKEKTFLILVIFLLFLINVFILVNFYQYKQKENIYKGKNLDESQNDELNSYKVNFTANIQNSNLCLSNVSIKDSLNNILPLSEMFDNTKKQFLVCRFSKTHCESCVSFSIKMLYQQMKLIGTDNVLFLGNFPNNRILNKTKPLYDIQSMNVYNASEFNIPAEELGYPYYFILDSSLRIFNVFVPDKATPNITLKYLESVQKKLK